MAGFPFNIRTEEEQKFLDDPDIPLHMKPEDYVPTPFEKKYFSEEMMKKYQPLVEARQKQDRDKKNPELKKEVDKALAEYCNPVSPPLSNWNYKKYDVVFYGVSGYTGYLMMQYLKRQALPHNKEKFTFAFAGRTYEKVEAMRDREFAGTEYADTPILTARFDDVISVIDLVKSGRVIVNVAGPYMLTEADVLVDACIWLKSDYIDISGETPWSLRCYELHKKARDAGVMVIPSVGSGGGFPDLGVYLCVKKLKEDYGEETRYAQMYLMSGGITAGASGGTLKTRAAMNQADDSVKMAMADPFSMGGFIPDIDKNGVKNITIAKGTGIVTCKARPEDMDVHFSRVSKDEKIGCWRAPYVYAFFDSRVIRRSNMLMADLCGAPYGAQMNYMEFLYMPSEDAARAMTKGGGGASVEEEKKRLIAEGKYYKEGEGPPIEELTEAWMLYMFWAETPSGKSTKLSIRGLDGYYETARVAIEMALTLRFDRADLPTRGGCLTPAVAGGAPWAKRVMESGAVFTVGEWEDVSHLADGFKQVS